MTLSLDLSHDFAVFDGGQDVVIRGPRTAAGVVPADRPTAALRRSVTTREIAASRGKYTAGDVRWHFPTTQIPTAPTLGATIVEEDGRAWTILETSLQTLGSRWCCTARTWEIAAGLGELVTVLEAEWTKTASGVPTAEWREVRRGIAARIQPLERRTDTELPTIRATHRCYLAEAIEVTATLRVRCGDAVYEVRGVDDAERLDRGLTLLLETVPPETAS
jgi:head-tail adaptor